MKTKKVLALVAVLLVFVLQAIPVSAASSCTCGRMTKSCAGKVQNLDSYTHNYSYENNPKCNTCTFLGIPCITPTSHQVQIEWHKTNKSCSYCNYSATDYHDAERGHVSNCGTSNRCWM